MSKRKAAAEDGEHDEAVKAAQRLAVQRYEHDQDLVPGTAWWRGDERRGGPEGGQTWEGRARMAAARMAAGRRLDGNDRVALDRHPEHATP